MKLPMPHEYAALFPMATEEELEGMAKNIKERGLLTPIILYEGKVLDGRNRLEACGRAGVEPRFEEYAGTDPLGDVISWNLHRRNLTTTERAKVGEKLANMRQGERTDVEPSVNLQKVSQSDAAKAVGVSPSLIAQTKMIKKEAPDLYEKLGTKDDKGKEFTVHAAKKAVEARKEESAAEREEAAYFEGNETEKKGEEPKRKENKGKKSEPPPEPAFAEQYATMAISQLERIRNGDPTARSALDRVAKWIEKRIMEIQ